MKLDVAVDEVVLSNVGATGEFRIRNSAKAFKILSDGLYSNKIRAIIRELSCNALDSHIAAGKADIPFEVHLPNMLEPWFSVRDYGLGLDGDQVENIYTTYFESTKTDSNDFIGALGLGSKSPFSYTDNFTVTAIKNGTKRIYSAFINNVGVPSIVEMSKELTDEGNGVEVKFSVTNRGDYSSFRHEAQNVFAWFKFRPTILGTEYWQINEPQFKEKNIVPGIHYRDIRESIAVMGNIPYPIKISEPEKHFDSLASLLNCGLVIEFEIGEVDFAASREELSYVPLTIASIKKKLEALNANLAIHLAAKADAIENEWKRAQFLYEQLHTGLYKSAVHTYVANTKFELVELNKYNYRFEFKFKVEDLSKRGLEVKAFRSSGSGSSTLKTSNEYIGGNYVQHWIFPVETSTIIVLNDLKTGCFSRARFHFNNSSQNGIVYCISHSDADLDVRQAEYDKLIAELHNPPVVMKASELMKPVRKRSLSTQGIMLLRMKDKSYRRSGSKDYTWTPYTEELDDTKMYYYIPLSNFESFDINGNPTDISSLYTNMIECGIKDISDIKILGVRKNKIKELQDLDNWQPFEVKLKEEINKLSDKDISSLVAAEMIDSYYNRAYINKTVAKLVGKDSPYSLFVDEFGSINKSSMGGNVLHLVALCSRFGKSVQVDAMKQAFTDAKDAIYKRYPLLQHCFSAKEREVAEYIKMVDKQEKT